jgi:hypothetical protein
MDKVQNLSNSEYHTKLSEPLRAHLFLAYRVQILKIKRSDAFDIIYQDGTT